MTPLPERLLDGEGGGADRQVALSLRDYQQSLRALMANMLRVSRGAGRPWEITREAESMLLACIAYSKAVGVWPSSCETQAALRIDWVTNLNTDEQLFHDAERQMVEGAMQLVASELLGQRTQRSAGSSQLHDGWGMKLDYVKRTRGVL